MSNIENDKIYEASLEKALEDGLDEAVFLDMDLEEKFEYLMDGTIPNRYNNVM